MQRYIIRRVGLALILVFVVTTIVFSILRLMPGDPVLLILSSETSQPDPETVVAVRHKLGLDQPIWRQYINWWVGMARLDLGNSLFDGTPVAEDIFKRLPRTLEIIVAGIVLGLTMGIPLGVVGALHNNRWPDYLVSIVSTLGISSPVYVVGTLLVLVFGLYIPWFPASGYVSFAEAPWEHFRKLTLPAIAIATTQAAIVARMTRSATLEVLGQDYIRSARSKGLRERVILYRHALANSLIPVVTVVGVSAGALLGGTVLVEFIFNWPGLSTLLMEGIYRRDYPVVQGVLVVTATLFIFLNLMVDLIYGILDPRIRYE